METKMTAISSADFIVVMRCKIFPPLQKRLFLPLTCVSALTLQMLRRLLLDMGKLEKVLEKSNNQDKYHKIVRNQRTDYGIENILH